MVSITEGLVISTTGSNYTSTDVWDIQLESVEKGFYGYGYGSNFYSLTDNIGLDYFNILDIRGSLLGYGISGTECGAIDSYTYGWGFEFTDSIISDNSDQVMFRAVVTENGLPVSGINVVFLASPGVILDKYFGVSDANGYVYTLAKFNSDETFLNNFSFGYGTVSKTEEIPESGLFNVRAMIDAPRLEISNEISTSSGQSLYDEVVFTFSYRTYSYQHYCYSYNYFV